MRGYAAAGMLLAVGVFLMWAGVSGRAGQLLGAIVAPQAMQISDAG